MFRKQLLCLCALMLCLGCLALPAAAADVDSDSVYCFTSEDFSCNADPLVGVCIMELPEPAAGTVMLGTRIVQPGDIFTAEQLAQMTFCPVRSEEDAQATVQYLPIYEDRVDQTAVMTISIRGKKNKAPTAKDLTVETYKNIPNEGKLKASDPEGEKLTYTVTRQPRRGTVEVREDGTFTYTPKKNKVGVDSFTYTAADPAGKVSKEATVTVQILKPTQADQYQDTVGLECRFEAEWLRSTGLFAGEKIGGRSCFQPEKVLTKGEFLAMMLETLDAPVEKESSYTGIAQDAPDWLKPYLAAALRSGLLKDVADTFDIHAPITGEEAAVMLQNALDLTVKETMAADEELSVREVALAVMNENGFQLSAQQNLTRGDGALLMYQLHRMDAPGKAVFRSQKN